MPGGKTQTAQEKLYVMQNSRDPNIRNQAKQLQVTGNTLAPVQAKPNPVLESAQNKLTQAPVAAPVKETAPAPLSTVQKQGTTTFNDPLAASNVPTLENYIADAQKLSNQKMQAQAQILGQQTGDIASQFASKLYGQNVGATSGVGMDLTNRAIQDQAKRLEPYAMQQAAELGSQALQYQRQDTQTAQENARQDQDKLLTNIVSGIVDKSQLTPEILSRYGITDPNAVKTLNEVDFATTMTADGLDPNNPQHVEKYKTDLRNAKSTQLKQSIISNYAQTNDGRIPTPDELEMMIYVFGGGTGLLTPQEETAIITKYNDDQWKRTMSKAKAMNPPEDSSVLCTELYRQGLLDSDIYRSDQEFGRYLLSEFPNIMAGYHKWGKPLANKMESSKMLTLILKPFITAWAKEIHNITINNGKCNILGRIMICIGIPICDFIGRGILTCQEV